MSDDERGKGRTHRFLSTLFAFLELFLQPKNLTHVRESTTDSDCTDLPRIRSPPKLRLQFLYLFQETLGDIGWASMGFVFRLNR
jgi:hypothetical protein